MASGSCNSSGLSESRCAPIVQEHTRECLDEIRNMQDGRADIIILLGRTGVGKSALLEYITDASGHSKQSDNPVTLEFQIEPVEIDGNKYYIMDTPGFDIDKEREVFLEIIRGIKAVRPYARIIGVMLVARINDNRAEAIDNKLVDFVEKFCGNEYIPQVTVVTTFWNVSEDEEKLEFDERLQGRLQRWRRTLGQELKQYQHGRRYQNGSDTGACLRWRRDRDDIKQYAKEMVSRHYGNLHPQDPRIVQELLANSPLEKTAAGKFLKLTPVYSSFSTPSSSSSSSLSTSTSSSEQPAPEEQPELSSPRTSSSGTTPDEAPRSSASTAEAPDLEADDRNWNHDRDERQPKQEWDPRWKDLFFKVGNLMVDKVIPAATRGVAGGVGGGVAIGGLAGFPNGLDPDADIAMDPLSSVDHFRARGMPTDLGYRTMWAQQRGIRAEAGSSAFGNAVRSAIMRESPL